MQQLSSKKRRAFLAITLGTPLVILLGLGGMIVAKLRSWAPMLTHKTSVFPNGPMYRPDALLGFVAIPGAYRLRETLEGHPGELSYDVRIENDGSRATSASPGDDTKPQVWIYGCSFTWGQGLSDAETFPYKVQTKLPKYRIKNYGQNGYGTTHALLQLRQQLETSSAPAYIVLGYITWHEQRNVADPHYVEELYWFSAFQHRKVSGVLGMFLHKMSDRFGTTNDDFGLGYTFPRASLAGGKLTVSHIPLASKVPPTPDLDWGAVTRAVFDEIFSLCREHKITPIVLRLWNPKAPEDPYKTFFEQRKVIFQEAYIDYSDPNWNNAPINGHPNAKANDYFADRLFSAIQSSESGRAAIK